MTKRRRARSAGGRRALLATCLLLASAPAGCGSSAVAPRADLSDGLPAQSSFARVRARWETDEWHKLPALEDPLVRHIQQHEKDPSARPARGMLALLMLQKDPGRALQHARILEQGAEGSSRDMARVVLGALERRRGGNQTALADLRPLFNKVIDPPTRALLNQELAIAALGANEPDAAATYVRALLEQSTPPLRSHAEGETATLLARLPPAPLLRLLRDQVSAKEPDRWFSTAIAVRLKDLVIADQDPRLARALLEIAPSLIRDDADAVARVAARGAGVRLERNTVGLLMPLRSDDLSRRGIEVVAGLALALDLPGGSTKLLVRDDQREIGRVEEALALLNADGAAVIVAGFDTREADVALTYAERTNVPLVLLRPPSRPVRADGPVFVLGEGPHQTREALVLAMQQRGKKRIALYVEERNALDLGPAAASAVVAEQPCGASLEFARTAGADALVVDGGRACAALATDAAGGLSLGFGLDARPAGGHQGLFATAGIFPLTPGPSDDPLIDGYRKKERGEPSWWVGLGHDVGLLVKDAVQGLPTEADEAAAAVAIRKRIVADAIARSEARLWTTEAKGFEGARVIKRTIATTDRREGPGGKAKKR